MSGRVLARLTGCERGAAAVEFSIVGMILIMLLVGILDFGRTLYIKNQLSLLADQAARRVLINPSISNGSLESALRADFSAGAGAQLGVAITTETVSGNTFRVLSITYPVTLFIPNLSDDTLTLSVTRRVPSN